MANDSPPLDQLQAEQDRQQIVQSGADPFGAARAHLGLPPAPPVQPMAEGKGKILGAIHQAGQPRAQTTLTLGTPGAPAGMPATGPEPDALAYGINAGTDVIAHGATAILDGLNALVDTTDPVRSQARGAALILKGATMLGFSPFLVPLTAVTTAVGQILESVAPELAKADVASGYTMAAVRGALDPFGALASATDIGTSSPEGQARLADAARGLTAPMTFKDALTTGLQISMGIAAGHAAKGAKAAKAKGTTEPPPPPSPSPGQSVTKAQVFLRDAGAFEKVPAEVLKEIEGSLPPIPPGSIRLFRAEDAQGRGPYADTTKGVGGRYFTNDLNAVLGIARDIPGRKGQVTYLDIPKDHPQLVQPDPGLYRYDEFALPESVAQQRQPVIPLITPEALRPSNRLGPLPNITAVSADLVHGTGVPKTVLRVEEKGAVVGGVDKPHGLYTSPGHLESPHADLGGTVSRFATNPDAKVLHIDESVGGREVAMRRDAIDAGAGVHAARQLLGPEEFSRLKGLSMADLISEAKTIDPTVNWSKYFDRQEVMEGIGGTLARKAGYDAIWMADKTSPAFSEYVALRDNAFQTSAVAPLAAGAVSPPTLAVAAPAVPTILKPGATGLPAITPEALQTFIDHATAEPGAPVPPGGGPAAPPVEATAAVQIPRNGQTPETALTDLGKIPEADPARCAICYKLAGEKARDEGGIFVMGKVDGAGGRIDHAWVERGNAVWDPQYNLWIDKSTYYADVGAGNIQTQMTGAEVRAHGQLTGKWPSPEHRLPNPNRTEVNQPETAPSTSNYTVPGALPAITPEALQGFIDHATAEPGAPVPPEGTLGPRIFGVNWRRLGQEQDVNRAILKINADLSATAKMPAVEGANLPTNFADITARARELGVTLDDVMALPTLPRRVTNLEQLDAFTAGVRAVRDVIANRLVAEAKMGAAGDVSARASTQTLMAMLVKAAEADKLTGENLAQALGARRMASNAETAAEGTAKAVMDFVDRLAGLDGHDQLPEMITAVAKPRGKASAFLDHVGNILGTGKDILWEVWINDLLGPVTAGTKTLGDLVMLAKEPPHRLMARWNQKLFPMLFEGKPLEVLAPGEGWAFARGAAETIPTAVLQAFRSVKAGELDVMEAAGENYTYPNKLSAETLGLKSPDSLMDFSPDSLPGKLVNGLGMTIRAAGTSLGIITRVAKAANYAGAARAVATREAVFQGLDGAAAERYITDAVANASKNSAMADEATRTAQQNTFTQESGPFGQALTTMLNTAHLRSQAPFLRVPINLEKTGTQMIFPFNVPSLLWGEMRQALDAGGVQRARAMASLETGVLLSATVAYLTAQRIVTGACPNNRAFEEQRAAAGEPCHSLLLGGQAYDYNKIKPVGTMIGLTATATEAWAQLPNTESALGQMGQVALIHALSWGRVIQDAQYFKGVKDLVAAIAADDVTVNRAAGHMLKGLVGSLPPNTWARTPNRLYFDTIMRDAGTVNEAFLKGIPGYSQTVAPHVDMLHGDPTEYPASLGPDLVSPIPMHAVNPDPVAKTLNDNGIIIKALPWKVYPGPDEPGIPLKAVDPAVQGIDLTSWQRHQWSQLMLKESIKGQTMYEAIDQRIHTLAFERASPGMGGGRDALVQEVVRGYQQMGHDRLLLENDDLRAAVTERTRQRIIQKWTGGTATPPTGPGPSLGR